MLELNVCKEVSTDCTVDESFNRTYTKVLQVMTMEFRFEDKEQDRKTMVHISDLFRNWNYAASDSDEYNKILADIDEFIATKGGTETAEVNEEAVLNIEL